MRQAFLLWRNTLPPRLTVEKDFGMPDQSDSARRLKTTNTVLAIVILVLLGQAAWQAMRMSAIVP